MRLPTLTRQASLALGQHLQRQRHEFVVLHQREDVEERRHRTYPSVLLELHLLRHMAAGDLARRRIDVERLGGHDRAEAQRASLSVAIV